MSEKNQLIFLGPPGSGKGTQAKILAERFSLAHISTGDLFRDQISRQTSLGRKVESILASGQLVSDDITNAIVAERLQQNDASAGFIFDGYPRNLVQAEFLFKLQPEAVVINIELSDEEVLRRIAGRRLSRSTGAIYHLEFNPPPANLPTDDLIQRTDETEAVVTGRLADYHRLTEPLKDFYRAKGKLFTVDGSPAIAVVTKLIMDLLAK